MKRMHKWTKKIGVRRFSLGHIPQGDALPETPQECDERTALARMVRQHVREQVVRLPWLNLLGAERRAQGGLNFQGAPMFVETLCQTILEHPERYPDLLERATFLLSRHKEADAWSGLNDELGSMQEVVNDHMLMARGESVSGAVEILQRLEGLARFEEWGSPACLRMLGLMAAKVLLDTHREATGRGKQRAAEKQRPENKEARRRRKERWEAQLIRCFQRILRRPSSQG